jgi:hypothetical protein
MDNPTVQKCDSPATTVMVDTLDGNHWAILCDEHAQAVRNSIYIDTEEWPYDGIGKCELSIPVGVVT